MVFSGLSGTPLRMFGMFIFAALSCRVYADPIALQHKGAVVQIPAPVGFVDVRLVDSALLAVLDDGHPMNTDELAFITKDDARAYLEGRKMDLDVMMKVISSDSMPASDVPVEQIKPFRENLARTFSDMIAAGDANVREYLKTMTGGGHLDPNVSVVPLTVDRYDGDTVQMTMLVLSQYNEAAKDFNLIEVVSSSVCYCSKRILSMLTILRMKERSDIQRATALNRRWFDRVNSVNY